MTFFTSKRAAHRGVALTVALVLPLAAAGVARADNLEVDGDGLVPVAQSSMNLGDVCIGQSKGANALLAIKRVGSGNVFANNAAITVSGGAPSSTSVTQSITDGGILLPWNWDGVGNNTMSGDIATSAVSVVGAAPTGATSATILYSASGTNAGTSPATLTRTATLTVNWNVVSCDTTPPVVTPTVAGTLGLDDWYTSDVSISWSVTDPESAISSSSGCGNATVSTDTAGQTFTCSATSLGGTTSQSVTVKRDATPPSIGGSGSGTAGSAGWYVTSVDVTFVCNDAMSGVASCGPNQTLTDGSAVSASGTATDNAGNSASTSVGPFDIDTIAPSISGSATPAPNANGWNNTSVDVSYTCADGGGSAIASCGPNETLSSDGAGQSSTGTAVDLAGNNASTTVSGIKIDTVAPVLGFIGGPADGGVYYSGFVPALPTCSISDALSGPGTCSVAGYGTMVGSHTVTASGTDNAGNAGSTSRTYTVESWTAVGFHRPVDKGVMNTVKGGSTVPLKFEAFVGSTELTDVAVIHSLWAAPRPCSGGDEAPVEELAAAGSTLLRYDWTEGQFIYNWKTPKKPGTCYTVTLTLMDGSKITADFQLK